MLSRTAENLFWMGRYIERAESTARIIGMGARMAMMPGRAGHDEEWRSVAAATGCAERLDPDKEVDQGAIVRTLILDRDNPSSILSSLGRARENGRAVRTALTTQRWEALNDTWLKVRDVNENHVQRNLSGHLDWVRERCALFQGATEATHLRNDGYDFFRLGVFVERADLTLRLLDVKYYVLLPETEVVGGGRDHHQWTSLLYATSSQRAYHHVYRGDYSPWRIADFLILNLNSPRSVSFCYDRISGHLDRLGRGYGVRHNCHLTANQFVAVLKDQDMGQIFQTGLHEFLTQSIARNNRLSMEIAEAYLF